MSWFKDSDTKDAWLGQIEKMAFPLYPESFRVWTFSSSYSFNAFFAPDSNLPK